MTILPKNLTATQKKLHWKTLFFIVLLTGLPVFAHSSSRVALVLDVKGLVELISVFDGFEDESPLMRTNYLSPGNKVRIAKGGQATLLHLRNMQRYVFAGPDEILVKQKQFQRKNNSLKTSTCAKPFQKNLVAMLEKNRISLKKPQSVIGVRDLAGKKFADIVLSTPVDQEKILATYPEFSWNAIPGIDSYRFVLKIKRGATLLNTKISTNHLRLPNMIRLKNGKTYTWQVTSAIKSKKIKSLEWSFVMVSRKEQADLNLLYPGEKAEISEHILYVMFLEKMGLAGEAKKHWRILQKLQPNDPLIQKKAR